MKGLARICEDGIGSISSSVRDLETHGYPIDTRSKEAISKLLYNKARGNAF